MLDQATIYSLTDNTRSRSHPEGIQKGSCRDPDHCTGGVIQNQLLWKFQQLVVSPDACEHFSPRPVPRMARSRV